MLQTMVDRTKKALDDAGVPVAKRQQTLTLAGLVQKEGNGPDDAKVARVFLNRIAQGMLLQSDARVSYGAGGTTVVPTTKQYASDNGTTPRSTRGCRPARSRTRATPRSRRRCTPRRARGCSS